MSKNIRFIRLINGDDVVAETKSDERFLILRRPIQIMASKNAAGLREVMILPWLPINSCDNDEVDINHNHVLFSIPITDKMEGKIKGQVEKYMEQVYTIPADEEAPAETINEVITDDAKKTLEQLSNLLKGANVKGKKPN